MSLSRQKRLDRAQMRVLFQVPFFAPGVAKMPVVWDDKIPTACTDGREIRWSPAFFDGLKDQELVTVLCHEVAHCMLGHLWRVPTTAQGADGHLLWNEATDHAINLMLEEFSALVTAKRLADPFPFPKQVNGESFDYLHDTAYAGLAEEVIFSKLQKQPKGKGGGAGGKGASKPGIGQFAPVGNQQSSAKQKALKSDWEGTLVNATKIAAGRGELPGSIERLVETLVNPQVPWTQVVQAWLREQCADDWDWLTPALEYEGSGFILPGMAGERYGRIVFATDTSGSIDQALLAQFQSEKQSALDELKPKSLLDIYCDSKIHKVAEYSPGDVIAREAPGGGGTDFRPVFRYVEKLAEIPRALVYLTDLDGQFPDHDPGYPVIFVTWTKGGQAPFGQVIYAQAS